MSTDIRIKYVNDTNDTDFQVVVFTKNFSMNTPETHYTAWQILQAHSSVQFIYPASTAVGATYTNGGQLITAGPFPAPVGSTWEITQPSVNDAAILTQGKMQSYCTYLLYPISK